MIVQVSWFDSTGKSSTRNHYLPYLTAFIEGLLNKGCVITGIVKVYDL